MIKLKSFEKSKKNFQSGYILLSLVITIYSQALILYSPVFEHQVLVTSHTVSIQKYLFS